MNESTARTCGQPLDAVGQLPPRAHQLEEPVPGDVAQVADRDPFLERRCTSGTYMTLGASRASPKLRPAGSRVA